MIEIFDNFLNTEEVGALHKTMKRCLWILEESLPYMEEGLFLEGGSGYYRIDFKNTEHNIFHDILDKIQNHPLIQNEYFLVGAGRNSYKIGDTAGLHQDEGDLTALVYGNSEWHINWGSETIFTDGLSPNSDIIKSVIPKPGRLVIFDSKIPHTGRPPSASFINHRYSVAYVFKKKN